MKQHIEIRKQNECPNSKDDYIDLVIVRRISRLGCNYELKNSIYNETIAITLREGQNKIEIYNCEFKKGLFIRWDGRTEPKDYSFFVYKSDIKGDFNLTSFDIKKSISIDMSNMDKLFLSGLSEKIDLYGCTIDKLYMEDEKCKRLKIEKTKIQQYALRRIDINDIYIDAKELTITDYKRFIKGYEQTIADVSEIYHRLVLRIPKSIGETRKINYEIAKATSSKYLILFGYFFNPLYVFFSMLVIIVLFSLLYCFLLNQTIEQSIYFSIYTFLTIGFSDISENSHIFLKSILVFCEGFLGILYCAVFLTTIINSSKK